MRVRPAEPGDRNDVLEIHERFKKKWGGDWKWKDGQGTCLRLVVEEGGSVVGIIKGLTVVELAMMIDPAFGNPSDRAEAARLLGETAIEDLRRRGVPEVHGPFMPRLRGLTNRLVEKFGWVRDTRTRLIKDLRAV